MVSAAKRKEKKKSQVNACCSIQKSQHTCTTVRHKYTCAGRSLTGDGHVPLGLYHHRVPPALVHCPRKGVHRVVRLGASPSLRRRDVPGLNKKYAQKVKQIARNKTNKVQYESYYPINRSGVGGRL